MSHICGFSQFHAYPYPPLLSVIYQASRQLVFQISLLVASGGSGLGAANKALEVTFSVFYDFWSPEWRL